MSNETGLDWLARNVHVWNESAYAVMCGGFERVLWISGAAYGQKAEFKNAVTKDQWLARRAELQNKPSWNDAPEWATHLAQHSNGRWLFMLSAKVAASLNGWAANRILSTAGEHGEVLGDWRDTLEKRPKEFKPFISIEDNQEQDMTQQQEMKQDNEWLERGELPPVGFECEMKRIDGRWCKAVTVGKDSGGRMVCELNDNGVFYASTSSAESFRPIRTERDVLISVIIDEMNRYDTDAKLADAILEAGFKLEAK